MGWAFVWLMGLWPLGAHAWSNRTTYAADAFFAVDQSATRCTDSPRLNALVERSGTGTLEVVIAIGHADSEERDGQRLSERRAKGVKHCLMKLGVSPARIYTEGEGSKRPLSGAPRERHRRVEVESIGTTGSSVDTLDFALMAQWDADLREPRHEPQPPADEWAGVTPLQFLLTISEPQLRADFLAKMMLLAVRQREDDLLAVLHKMASAEMPPSAGTLAPALYAAALGNRFAQDLMRAEYARIPPRDAVRYAFALRLWCGPDHKTGLGATAFTVLPPDAGFAELPGETAFKWLDCATRRNSLEDIQLLHRQGLSLNAVDSNGKTALHNAVAEMNIHGAQALLQLGASAQLKDHLGYTPLHALFGASYCYALCGPVVTKEKRPLWKLLTQFGADPNEPNTAGKTPAQLMPELVD